MKISKDWVDAYFDRGVDVGNRRVFVGDITEDTIDKIIKGLYLIEMDSVDKPCEMFISSYGGSIYDALALYDIMHTLKCPVHTFAYGKCMSAAPLLLAAGEPGHRWVTQHVALMHHDWSDELDGKGAEVVAAVKHNETLSKAWTALLVKHTSKGARFWNRRGRAPSDFYFSAGEALKWGVADHIWREK